MPGYDRHSDASLGGWIDRRPRKSHTNPVKSHASTGSHWKARKRWRMPSLISHLPWHRPLHHWRGVARGWRHACPCRWNGLPGRGWYRRGSNVPVNECPLRAVDTVQWSDRHAYRFIECQRRPYRARRWRTYRGLSSPGVLRSMFFGRRRGLRLSLRRFLRASTHSTLRRWSRWAIFVRLHRTCPGARLLRYAATRRRRAGNEPAR